MHHKDAARTLTLARFTYLFEHVHCGSSLFLQPYASPDVRTFYGGLNRLATPEQRSIS